MSNVSFHTISCPHRDGDLDISCFLRRGSKDAIVYLHGLGSTKYDFWGAIDAASLSGHTLLAIDFPGSGSSSLRDDQTVAIDDLVDITESILSSFDFTDVTLIGHSMGGLTGLRLVDKHPSRVRRFINVEGNIAPEDCGVFSRRTASLTWDDFVEGQFMKVLQAEFASLPYLGAQLFADRFRGSIVPSAFRNYCISIVEHSDSGALMPAFTGMSIPRLFVYGQANGHLSYLSDLAHHGIQVVEVPQSHHWPHLDNPTFFFQHIGDFIAQS